MTQGAAESVEFPDDQGVAGPELIEDLGEDGPVGAGAAGRLGEHPIAADVLEGVDLELWLLIGGGDAGIAKEVSHAGERLITSRQRRCGTLIADIGSGTARMRTISGIPPGRLECPGIVRFWTRDRGLGRTPWGRLNESSSVSANGGNRCAIRRCCRSRSTVEAEVKCSPGVQLCMCSPHRSSLMSIAPGWVGHWIGKGEDDPHDSEQPQRAGQKLSGPSRAGRPGSRPNAVLRLLPGESLEELSRELNLEAHRVAAWRDGGPTYSSRRRSGAGRWSVQRGRRGSARRSDASCCRARRSPCWGGRTPPVR